MARAPKDTPTPPTPPFSSRLPPPSGGSSAATSSVRLDIYVHDMDDPRLDQILTKLDTIIGKETVMAGELDALTAQVAQNNSVVDSALTFIQGLKDQITAAGTDPAKLAALTQALTDKDQALASAIAANTPAATP